MGNWYSSDVLRREGTTWDFYALYGPDQTGVQNPPKQSPRRDDYRPQQSTAQRYRTTPATAASLVANRSAVEPLLRTTPGCRLPAYTEVLSPSSSDLMIYRLNVRGIQYEQASSIPLRNV